MNPKLNKGSNPTKTVLVIATGFIIIYLVSHQIWALYVSLCIGLLGIFSDFWAKKIEWLWMKLAFVLGKIVPNILLSLIFYVFLTPIALMSKLFGEKNPLHLKNTSNSLFKVRNKQFEPVDFEKPW